MNLPRLLLEVCSPCQYTCVNCAHQGLRDVDPKYQMSLEEVQALVSHFKLLGVTIDNIQIHGPGEPLIWKHFNVGIKMMKEVANRFVIVTNGFSLEKIEPDIWPFLSLIISKYPETTIDDNILKAHPGQYDIVDRSKFLEVTNYPHPKIWTCVCAGPSLYNGNIYPLCGPPLWDALPRMGGKIENFAIPLGEYDPNKKYEQDVPCLYCWANVDMDHFQYNQQHTMRKNLEKNS